MLTIAKLPAAIAVILAIAALSIGLSLSSGNAGSNPVAAGNAAPLAQAGELLWSYKTKDYQPISVADGVLYGNGYVDLKHYLYAVNPATGELLWRFQTGGNVITAPTVADGVVYVWSEDSFVYALNEQSGELIWRYRVSGEHIPLPALLRNGKVYESVNYFMSPLVSGGTVFVSAVRSIHALSASTGNELWNYSIDETDEIWRFNPGWDVRVGVQAISDGVLYVAVNNHDIHSQRPNNHYLLALDAATGSLHWQSEKKLWRKSWQRRRWIHPGV